MYEKISLIFLLLAVISNALFADNDPCARRIEMPEATIRENMLEAGFDEQFLDGSKIISWSQNPEKCVVDIMIFAAEQLEKYNEDQKKLGKEKINKTEAALLKALFAHDSSYACMQCQQWIEAGNPVLLPTPEWMQFMLGNKDKYAAYFSHTFDRT